MNKVQEMVLIPQMAKQRKKGDLPTKVCVHCERPFTWRKKWERNWEEVKYCSRRCRQEAKTNHKPG